MLRGGQACLHKADEAAQSQVERHGRTKEQISCVHSGGAVRQSIFVHCRLSMSCAGCWGSQGLFKRIHGAWEAALQGDHARDRKIQQAC